MRRWFHWFTLSAFAAFMAATPTLAVSAPASSAGDHPQTLAAPAAVQSPAPQPVPSSPVDKPVLTARAPFDTVWNTTILSMNSQAMGLHATRANNNHVRWTIAGACVGAIVGVVAGEPLSDAAIGALVGLGASYVMPG